MTRLRTITNDIAIQASNQTPAKNVNPVLQQMLEPQPLIENQSHTVTPVKIQGTNQSACHPAHQILRQQFDPMPTPTIHDLPPTLTLTTIPLQPVLRSIYPSPIWHTAPRIMPTTSQSTQHQHETGEKNVFQLASQTVPPYNKVVQPTTHPIMMPVMTLFLLSYQCNRHVDTHFASSALCGPASISIHVLSMSSPWPSNIHLVTPFPAPAMKRTIDSNIIQALTRE
jgi:hypothetical protein